jgi:hypothetical protein
MTIGRKQKATNVGEDMWKEPLYAIGTNVN